MTSYSINVRFTDHHILIESMYGSKSDIGVVVRGSRQDIDAQAVFLKHHQAASMELDVDDSEQATTARLSKTVNPATGTTS